jgi:hypothetical protein
MLASRKMPQMSLLTEHIWFIIRLSLYSSYVFTERTIRQIGCHLLAIGTVDPIIFPYKPTIIFSEEEGGGRKLFIMLWFVHDGF